MVGRSSSSASALPKRPMCCSVFSELRALQKASIASNAFSSIPHLPHSSFLRVEFFAQPSRSCLKPSEPIDV